MQSSYSHSSSKAGVLLGYLGFLKLFHHHHLFFTGHMRLEKSKMCGAPCVRLVLNAASTQGHSDKNYSLPWLIFTGTDCVNIERELDSFALATVGLMTDPLHIWSDGNAKRVHRKMHRKCTNASEQWHFCLCFLFIYNVTLRSWEGDDAVNLTSELIWWSFSLISGQYAHGSDKL